MFSRFPRIAVVLAIVATVISACGGKGPGAATGTGGSAGGASGRGGGAGMGVAGTQGDAGFDAGAPGDGSAGGAIGSRGCDEMPPPLRTAGTVFEFSFEMFLDGQPFVYGESNALPTGGSVTPLNVRFYVSEIELLDAGGASVPVDIVTTAGVPVPYGVHLWTAEDATSHAIRVLAPPGEYTGLRFLLGINDACNSGDNFARKAPLSGTSQMTWPPPYGYLFLRYDSLRGAGVQDPGPPPSIHMGGFPGVLFAPVVRVDGALTVPGSAAVPRNVRVAMDQVFKGATTDADLTGVVLPPGDEVVAGERLRRRAASLPLFTFGP